MAYPYVSDREVRIISTQFGDPEARTLAGLPRYDDARPAHKIAASYFPGVYFERDEWDFAVDVTDFFEKRVEAEATFVTQGHTPEWSRKRMEVTLGNAGWFSGTAYAEGFVQEKAFLQPKIVLPDSVLKAAEEVESVRHERMVAGATAAK